ncbi:MAG: hypothetical protein ABL986_04710 [Vicinamibacterales bacterium]
MSSRPAAPVVVISFPTEFACVARALLPPSPEPPIAGTTRTYLVYRGGLHMDAATYVDPIDGTSIIDVRTFGSDSEARDHIVSDIAQCSLAARGVQ